jgi:hypothetical protein
MSAPGDLVAGALPPAVPAPMWDPLAADVYPALVVMALVPGTPLANARDQASALNGWGTPILPRPAQVGRDSANVRVGPGTGYVAVGGLPAGTVVRAWREVGGWWFVVSEHPLAGWVWGELLTVEA